ncbi:MAG TPA: hypothetical protein VMZ31_04775 [Phycisphaerae bacterium]|nr:hypothetical protein [Phycisphaerae bacterium]
MVRRLARVQIPGWQAALAIVVGVGALLWHVLACTESPMAFSPSGKDLAFVTVEPYKADDDGFVAGAQVFRLMVLSEGGKLRVVEEASDSMLSAPAYSPDGKHLCYLRIPLLTEREAKRLHQQIGECEQAWEEAEKRSCERESLFDQPPGAATRPATQPSLAVDDQALPSLAGISRVYRELTVTPTVRVSLVVRDAKTDTLICQVAVVLPYPENLMISYLTVRPQYTPDGGAVYLCLSPLFMRVDLASGEVHVVAVPAQVGALSPDGRTAAVIQEGAIGFVRTDGQRTIYRRWSEGVSPSGMVWIDSARLALLTADSDEPVLQVLLANSDTVETLPLKLPEHARDDANMGELAIAPDGKHMVVSYGENVFFMSRGGEVLRHWHADEGTALVQPTFAPDSKRVAFKLMVKQEGSHPRADSIAFFGPNGSELSRRAIPRIDPASTRPTSQPVDAPLDVRTGE